MRINFDQRSILHPIDASRDNSPLKPSCSLSPTWLQTQRPPPRPCRDVRPLTFKDFPNGAHTIPSRFNNEPLRTIVHHSDCHWQDRALPAITFERWSIRNAIPRRRGWSCSTVRAPPAIFYRSKASQQWKRGPAFAFVPFFVARLEEGIHK